MKKYLRRLKIKAKQLVGKELNVKIDKELKNLSFGNPGCMWTIAPKFVKSNDIVYSFGVGTDISFDISIIEKYNVLVFAFDPTPRSNAWLKTQILPDGFLHYSYALAAFDGKIVMSPPKNPNHVSYRLSKLQPSDNKESFPCKRLSTIMKELKHDYISILKMDIEGAEIDALRNIISEKIKIGQILVEFHHRFETDGVKKVQATIRMLQKAGYKLFSISENFEELSFINQSLLKV